MIQACFDKNFLAVKWPSEIRAARMFHKAIYVCTEVAVDSENIT